MTSRTEDTGHRAQGTGYGATDAEIDRALDAVARRMTEGSPANGADFRRRVLARIEEGHPPDARLRAAWVLSPLAVAATIVMAILVARGFQLRDRGPAAFAPRTLRRAAPEFGGASSEQRRERAAPRETPAVANGPARQLEPLSRRRGARLQPIERRPPEGPRYTDVQNTFDALAAPSLDLAPLTVDALAPDSIQLEPLDTISRITISPIAVTPLDITDVQGRYE